MYTETERNLFSYFNGEREVFGDPMRIWRRLNNLLKGNIKQVLEEAKLKDLPEVSDAAQEKILAAATKAFDMVPFDPETGAGAMETHTLAALKSFLGWVGKKKVNTDNLLTSPVPITSPHDPSPTTSILGSS